MSTPDERNGQSAEDGAAADPYGSGTTPYTAYGSQAYSDEAAYGSQAYGDGAYGDQAYGEPTMIGGTYPTQYPSAGQYPAGGQYPSGGQYPAGGQYPSGGQYPAGGQYPMMPPPGGSGGGSAKAVQIGLSVLIVVLLAVGGFLLWKWQSGDSPGGSGSSTAVTTTTTETTTTSETTSTTTSTPANPGAALRQQADADYAQMAGPLNNTWTAQISAKQQGLVADGKTWYDTDILEQYQSFASRYPNAKLLWSGQWPVFNHSDWWVTVIADRFTTPEAANGWCRQQGFSPDDCFAKMISSSRGPAGTTVYWK